MFKTIEKEAEAEVVEKKSKFIANMFYVENEKEAEEILNSIRKKHYDARHHCYVYRIRTKSGIIEKQSDDGEPSGTAGAPMLNILAKKEFENVLVVITRYFGGILLGTGGLVKAYSDATKEVIQKARYIEKEIGYVAEIVLGYEEIGKFEYICGQNNIKIIGKEYAERIKIIIEISKEKYEKNIEKYLKNNFQNITITIKDKKYITK